MRKVFGFGFGAVVALALASPAVAQEVEQETPDFDAMTADELIGLFRSSGERWIEESCDFGVPILEAVEAKVGLNESGQRTYLFAQIFCADESDDYAVGATKLAELQAANPELELLDLQLYFDERLDDADAALGRLQALDFESAGNLSDDRYWTIARMISQQGQGDDLNDLALEWSQNGLFGAISRDLQSGLAYRALEAAAKQGQPDMARNLLGFITSPGSYISLLTERKFEAMWPVIGERAGKNLAKVGAENVELTASRLENNRDDRDRFSAAAYALHYNGQFEDAIALAEQWRKRESRGASLEEGDGWALNIQAYAYDSLGQPEKADVVFDELAAVDPDENYWVVSFVINRASRLVGQGRWEEGLEAAALARSVAEDYGSTYAKMIIARDYACALKKLGRADEASEELTFLRENVEDGLVLAVQGLICHGLNDEAAEMMLKAFADPVMRPTAIAAFETGDLDLFYTQSILPDATALLDDYPAIAAELAKYVRPIPREFIPQASLIRKKLDLPEWQ